MKPHRTTAREFSLFKAEFKRWQRKLGLLDWRVYFRLDKTDGNYAELHWGQAGSAVATIVLADEVSAQDAADLKIKTSAKHEALHLLTCRFMWLANSRCIQPSDLPEEWERLTMKLEKLIGGAND